MLRFSVFLTWLVASSSFATIDAYPFPNEHLEKRYDDLIAELRCPQCLNTNLAGSDAMIAQDLRREVHRMLLDGKADDEILDFMYERYGDFILYQPRVGASTFLLWFGPVILGLIAAFIWWRIARQGNEPVVMSRDDQKRLQELLQESERQEDLR
ncbi:MAG: cytochrome c-type biogenesis protein CcmH [Pseudomonadales bacterium]|nr:cytochrome c-type biogenesis protein CcmH [Pseudomonadales bacterium]MBO6565656.1 cytochrome c-type biogenesis protein CcmH [Pseudomonadales bacterium]MBO6596208.1 cytochrome c-type biogenesis protein CcmH [Pseudomonadales bacterium]MBO6658657.1 cytochrome c-type biogenesis protein CcmH [Pseudomonadales bacterium]MBO6702819.1 cytochrome c-type biogenesis protein CcmH [Pseudomonadales bacterium]